MNSTDNTKKEKMTQKIYGLQRIISLLLVVLIFFPFATPTRVCEMIGKNVSLFTSAVSYQTLTSEMGRAFRMGWINQSTSYLLYFASVIMMLGIVAIAAGGCLSMANLKGKRLGLLFSTIGAAIQFIGLTLIYVSYLQLQATSKPTKVLPCFPKGFVIYAVLSALVLLISLIILLLLPKADAKDRIKMESQYKLFLMFLPFAALCFVFSYLPLLGWRYAFFDYSAGGSLSMDNFVGFKWFTILFENEATRNDVVRVLRNTLVMSGLGILTSWVPIAFAIFLNEIKNLHFRRFVQVFTTIPNFISWVLVYAIALAIFSTDGFINTAGISMGLITEGKNYLLGSDGIWFKMLLWGLWKGIGWSAIIYIAGISGIDQQLYEAATVDGADRFQRMVHITLPGLIPTYCVMLLMSIANILSNGMDQYLVFANAQNQNVIEVLDLYVYNLGITGGNIPLSTVVGMVKSLVSVILLFSANGVSKTIRGESIV